MIVIAVRGGDKLVLLKEEDGKRKGKVIYEDGGESGIINVDSVLARGYWEPAPTPPAAIAKALNARGLSTIKGK